jgi:hypothetical protein
MVEHNDMDGINSAVKQGFEINKACVERANAVLKIDLDADTPFYVVNFMVGNALLSEKRRSKSEFESRHNIS